MSKRVSLGRQERRRAEKEAIGVKRPVNAELRAYVDRERLAGRLYTREDLAEYIDTQRKAGQLYALSDVVDMLNDNTRLAVRIVFTAMMETHIAGCSKILRDVDPVVIGMFRDLERMTREDGLDYANAKMLERYSLAKRRSFRPIRGLEHLIKDQNGHNGKEVQP